MVTEPTSPVVDSFDATIRTSGHSQAINAFHFRLQPGFQKMAELSNLLIEPVTLNMGVSDDIKIEVSGQSKFACISGAVSFPSFVAGSGQDQKKSGWGASESGYCPFSSFRILAETMSGDINGNYPLMDYYLGLSSESGSIKVDVPIPQESATRSSRTSGFGGTDRLRTSGTITVN
ncbi:hypothetical protein LZ554_006431 [Drepanopeziza brunnea f. sp. 'monogermtubi']|nr:hypothetical protein LZ554_006431 [Drepanopeziza brunnea f. sp. 'monogermtubi']